MDICRFRLKFEIMKKLDLVYEICKTWAEDNFLALEDVTTRPDTHFYICELDESSLTMLQLVQLEAELEKHDLNIYSIDKYQCNGNNFEIWIE